MEKLYEMFAKVVAATVLVVALLTLSSFVTAFPLKWAWNASMVDVFGLKEIGYWNAFAMLWVAGLLLKAAPSKAS